ncbi:Retrovirus-related Pol polyprotein LINE-1 [Gossypium australe]|uniref:Retrovirus-related Pol polyprotein LINE-1 n=1 Tax=Gossypium australe TaxID=47621 RepID=A0A5B6WZT4_9ROSI|nr:Retrovirus-related Pol polyprotein LINE-1 [Gossypium australe]
MSTTHATFTDKVKLWNKEVYGHITHRKNLLKKKLDNVQKLRRTGSLGCGAFLSLEQEVIQFLSMPVSDEEIEKALFDMAPLKAPGSDGLHAIFYQSQWELVGPSIFEWVKRVFSGDNINPDLNNSLIVLIPKVQHSECFLQFRPISFCSVLYKLVMKVIANRFKVVFPKIIAPEQVGFVAGRNINDNIIIAQEVIHSMKSKQKNKRWMAIKIDLEKAYDRVRWDFIDASLQPAGLHNGKGYLDTVNPSRIRTYAYFKVFRGVLMRLSKPLYVGENSGWVYLNTDGSVKYVDMFVVARGLLRDRNGTWIVGFTSFCEGVREGSNSALVTRILLLLKLLSHWNLQHIPREENRIADMIVKLRRDREPELRLVDKNYMMSFHNV